MIEKLLLVLFVLSTLALSAQKSQSVENETVVVSNILLKGNKITKDKIVFRELDFAVGDTLNISELNQKIELSRENLLKLLLFHFVDIDLEKDSVNSNIINVLISVTERWYWIPYPEFDFADRNFNTWFEKGKWDRISLGTEFYNRNFRGRLEYLCLTVIVGYNQNYGITYEIPYLTKKQNFGIGVSFGYERNKEVAYGTQNDKQLYYFTSKGVSQKSIYSTLKLTYRGGFKNTHSLSIHFSSDQFTDSLLKLNPDFSIKDKKTFDYLTLSYLFKNDNRDDKSYPLDGHYFDFELTKVGLGIVSKTMNFAYLKTTFDWYKPISKRWYWASNVTTKLSDNKDQPYFLSRGLGFDNDFVRSFELYVVNGESFALTKHNLKYTILPPIIRKIPFLKSEKFNKFHFAIYSNLFFDAGYVYARDPSVETRLQNKFIYGGGVGIDIVTYYDLVFRFEYSMNMYGEKGFCLHFVAPI